MSDDTQNDANGIHRCNMDTLTIQSIHSKITQQAIEELFTKDAFTTSTDARDKVNLFRNSTTRLQDEFKLLETTPCRFLWVPGRVELAGKHVDYGGGFSTTFCVPKGFAVTYIPLKTHMVHILFNQESISFELNDHLDENKDNNVNEPGWSLYFKTVASRLLLNFGVTYGAIISISSDLPKASGLSSSSALVIIMFMVLCNSNDLQEQLRETLSKMERTHNTLQSDLQLFNVEPNTTLAVDQLKSESFQSLTQVQTVPTNVSSPCQSNPPNPPANSLYLQIPFKWNQNTLNRLYEYLGCIENGQSFGLLVGNKGVGTFGGSEDHTAIMSGEKYKAKTFRYCSTEFCADTMVQNGYFVIASSGVEAHKALEKQTEYNDASKAASEIASILTHEQADTRQKPLQHIIAEVARENGEMKLNDPKLFGILSNKLSNIFTKINKELTFTKEQLITRLEQFVIESNQIVPKVYRLFQTKQFSLLGEVSLQSHSLANTHLKNVVPECDFLTKSAMELGASGATTFGAGFGGSCWAYLEIDDVSNVKTFIDKWKLEYLQHYPEYTDNCSFFFCRPCIGVFEIQSR